MAHHQLAASSLERQGRQPSLSPIPPPVLLGRPFPPRLLRTRGGGFVGRAEGGAWSAAAETPAVRFLFGCYGASIHFVGIVVIFAFPRLLKLASTVKQRRI